MSERAAPLVRLLVGATLAVALIAVIAWSGALGAGSPALVQAEAAVGGPPGLARASRGAAADERVAVATAPARAVTSRRSFDDIFDELVALWREGAVGDGGELAAATADLVTELLVAHPDAGERTLMRVAATPAPWTAAGGDGLAIGRVAQVVLDFVLQRLASDSALAERLPALVGALVDSMPLSPDMANLAVDVLADRAYLGPSHEPILVELARRATGTLAFLAAPVQRLLLTVWNNLRDADGLRHVADLLTWFADSDGGPLRTAAMQRLLQSERYRDLVVDRLIADGDSNRMLDAALFAAQQLPPSSAISTLAALQSGCEHANLIGAYAWLAATDVERLRRAYEECLADDIMPRHRRSLVAAIGNVAVEAGDGLECARMAFDMDPDAGVRGVAFVAMCNNGSFASVAECLGVAMADPNFARHYALSSFVRGVEVLARREDRDLNLLDLATRFLLSQASLAPWDRDKLMTVRAEYVPR